MAPGKLAGYGFTSSRNKMIPPLVLLISIIGLLLNLSLAGLVVLPDLSAAMLLAAILAHRGNWIWALPGFGIHDLTLHWSIFATLPYAAIIPVLLALSDVRLGPGLPQRVVLMVIGLIPLLYAGWSLSQWILTVMFCVLIWHITAMAYARSA